MKNNIFKSIEQLIIQENLGSTIKSIEKIMGGLSHRIYKVLTDKGAYAVKELNAGIMKRKEAYNNFVFSEEVATIAKQNGINAVEAIKIKNDIMKQINNKYYMIFNWIDGKILEENEINMHHCEIMGEVLAKIHNIDFKEFEDENKKVYEVENFEWNSYINIAEEQNKKYVNFLKNSINSVNDISQKINDALKYVNKKLVISHLDLDKKNIIWQGNKPFIIDWEASGYVNPIIELAQVAWYWSGGDMANLDYKKFETVVDTYKKNSKIEIDKNIEKYIYWDFYNEFTWLNYNLKRSLFLKNEYEEDEIELIENEVIQSLIEINYKESQIDKIAEILKRKWNG